MKLINLSYEILPQAPRMEGVYKQIELAGRTCYKSVRKEGTTAKDFVDRMIKSQHYAMLEHGTVYLLFSECCYSRSDREFIDKYTKNPYSKVVYIGTDDDLVEQTPSKKNYLGDILGTGIYGNALYAITTNYRVLVENDWLDDLKYLCEPTEFHEKRVTVRFIADIHFYKDTTRHRVFSWAIESTRFCNYLKEKFGMSVSFMKPTWIKEEDIPELEEDCKTIESIYFKWINKGYQAQHAAYFLPQGTKAEVIMTGFVSDYNHFFDLRAKGTTGAPHPDVKALVEPLMCEFKKRDWI